MVRPCGESVAAERDSLEDGATTQPLCQCGTDASPMYFSWEETQQQQAGILRQCSELLSKGKLKGALFSLDPPEEAEKAHAPSKPVGLAESSC